MADQRGQSSWPCSFVTVSTALSMSLFCPYLLFHIMETGQNWYRWKATIMENPTPSAARIWIRTRRGHWDLPGNNQGGLDKEYWHFPFLEAPFLVLLRSHSSLSSRVFPMVFGMILEWKTRFG